MFEKTKQITENIAFFVPRNADIDQVRLVIVLLHLNSWGFRVKVCCIVKSCLREVPLQPRETEMKLMGQHKVKILRFMVILIIKLHTINSILSSCFFLSASAVSFFCWSRGTNGGGTELLKQENQDSYRILRGTCTWIKSLSTIRNNF